MFLREEIQRKEMIIKELIDEVRRLIHWSLFVETQSKCSSNYRFKRAKKTRWKWSADHTSCKDSLYDNKDRILITI
jgi:hypothetical protein